CAEVTAAAAAGPVPLTAEGWAEVADAVHRETGPATLVTTAAVPRPAALDHPVVRGLPAATIAALPRTARTAIAQLLLLCVQPALSRSGPAVAFVVDHLLSGGPRVSPPSAPPGTRSSPSPLPPSSPATRPAPPPLPPGPASSSSPPPAPTATSSSPTTTPAGRPSSAAPARRAAGPADETPAAPARPGSDISPTEGRLVESVTTPMGGVFFLPRVLDLIEPFPWTAGPLSEHPPGTVVGWLASRLTGASTDDPAVRLLMEESDEPEPAAEAALDGLTEQVADGLRRMLRTEPDDDLGWFWRRTASIDARPGWIEITFSLDDVDTRIRAAGLDLDPGFVWWLGAVVRFRYV
ncbi:hypothetical protein, partial [Actinoplanes subglobosus]